MSDIVILGAGPIGAATTRELLAQGRRVTVVTRSGTPLGGARAVRLDAGDPALAEIATGADVIVNALNLPYDQWVGCWPALHESIMTAAEGSGAALLLIGNLYGYRPGVLMTAEEPLDPPSRKGAVRARMWAELLDRHRAGRLRAAELRASDYTGPGALDTEGAHAGRRLVQPVLAGRTARVLGDPDAPHTWTDVDDIARTAAAVIAQQAWGRPWIVPSAPARSIRNVGQDVAATAGVGAARVSAYPNWLVRGMGLANPMMRELGEMLYQFEAPFVADGSATTQLLGVAATPWSTTVETMVDAWRGRVPTAA